MKKYPYSILFIITFLILLPFVWYNVFLEDLIVTASEEPSAPEVPVEQIVLLEGLLQDAVDQAGCGKAFFPDPSLFSFYLLPHLFLVRTLLLLAEFCTEYHQV